MDVGAGPVIIEAGDVAGSYGTGTYLLTDSGGGGRLVLDKQMEAAAISGAGVTRSCSSAGSGSNSYPNGGPSSPCPEVDPPSGNKRESTPGVANTEASLAVDFQLIYNSLKGGFSDLSMESLVLLDDGNIGLALRGVYGLAGVTKDSGKNGLSVGAGIMALGAQLDYALSPETALGGVQRLTLKKKF